jgi:hypothetical protein
VSASNRILRSISDAGTTISILPFDDYQKLELLARSRLGTNLGTYQHWKQFHEKLLTAANDHVRVSDCPTPPPDLYFSGDWFHELTDGFAVQKPKGVSAPLFENFQRIVVGHDKYALVSLCGELGTLLDGLRITILSDAIAVAWRDKPAHLCRGKLQWLGIQLD